MKKFWWSSSSGRIKFQMTLEQAQAVFRPGDVYSDAAWLVRRELKSVLSRIDPKTLREELRVYGAWDDEDLSVHIENLIRLVWIAGSDLAESAHVYNPVKRGECVECGANKADGVHVAF